MYAPQNEKYGFWLFHFVFVSFASLPCSFQCSLFSLFLLYFFLFKCERILWFESFCILLHAITFWILLHAHSQENRQPLHPFQTIAHRIRTHQNESTTNIVNITKAAWQNDEKQTKNATANRHPNWTRAFTFNKRRVFDWLNVEDCINCLHIRSHDKRIKRCDTPHQKRDAIALPLNIEFETHFRSYKLFNDF